MFSAIILSLILPAAALTPCTIQCINSATTSVDCDFFDNNSCVCLNPLFVSYVEQCLASACTPAEQTLAISFLNSICGTGVTSGVDSFPAVPTGSISLPTTTVTVPANPTATAVSPCIKECINSAVTSVNCQFFDGNACVCANPLFVPNVEQCLATACTPADQANAVLYLNSICRAGVSSGADSFPAVPTGSLSSTNMALPTITVSGPASNRPSGASQITPSSTATSGAMDQASITLEILVRAVAFLAITIIPPYARVI